jgi:hypothetical protein
MVVSTFIPDAYYFPIKATEKAAYADEISIINKNVVASSLLGPRYIFIAQLGRAIDYSDSGEVKMSEMIATAKTIPLPEHLKAKSEQDMMPLFIDAANTVGKLHAGIKTLKNDLPATSIL